MTKQIDFITEDFTVEDLIDYDFEHQGNIWIMDKQTFSKLRHMRSSSDRPVLTEYYEGRCLLGQRVVLVDKPSFGKGIL